MKKMSSLDPANPSVPPIDLAQLERDYYQRTPDPANPQQNVSFGTSGHRGQPSDGTFTETHILAIAQAICDYRRQEGIAGPLFMGKDTHAASAPAQRTALEVLAANGIEVRIQQRDGFTPTPAISRAILSWNQCGPRAQADGIIITPSHNPPTDGGFKYNPPHGGPADTKVTTWIQNRANELLQSGNRDVKRIPFESALKQSTTQQVDFSVPYIQDLKTVIDMDAIRSSGIKIGVDPLGGAAVHYWEPMRDVYGLNLTVVNPKVDPTFSFMSLDHDGKVRMDCSSKWAMRGLVQLQKQFDIAFGNDPDADRHGIVTPSQGLMDPCQYLAAAVHFLHVHRPGWALSSAVGKTVVSSAVIDRAVQSIGRPLAEVPVGFKWFSDGLFKGTYCLGGEESAGASFLRQDGTVWTTDKDGLILGLLAAEIRARTGIDPSEYYQHLAALLGSTFYRRQDTPTTLEEKRRLAKVTVASVTTREFAGAQIRNVLTHDPVNQASIGGLKVVTDEGWFAARPSGTENIVKLYAESFVSEAHLQTILQEAARMVGNLTRGG
jgi:phosphoglucomutase